MWYGVDDWCRWEADETDHASEKIENKNNERLKKDDVMRPGGCPHHKGGCRYLRRYTSRMGGSIAKEDRIQTKLAGVVAGPSVVSLAPSLPPSWRLA
jgi:hypothetical protein